MTFDFKELFDYIPIGVVIYEVRDDGRDFIVVDFNRAAEQIEQIPRADLIGKSVLEAFPGVREFGFYDVLQRVWKTGTSEHHPICLYKDQRISGWKENFVYKLSSGEIITFYEDRTDSKRTEQGLKESEERYRTVVERSNDGIALVRGNLHLYVNNKMLEIFGYDRPEEILGRPISLLVHPDDLLRVTEINYRRQKGMDVPGRYEFKGRRKNGESVYIEISASKVTYQGESASLIFLRDITLRKEEEEKLKQAEAEWQQTFDAMSDGVTLLSLEGTILRANKALASMLNLSQDALIGQKCHQVFHQRSSFIDGCPLQRCLASQKGEFFETFEPSLNRWLSISCSPLFVEEGKIKGFVHLSRDITPLKQVEEELRALSLTDDLTGLHNRRGFVTLAEQALKTAYRMKRGMWLLFTDLDDLKKINDTLGHQQGDQALIEITRIFKKTFRESDILGRIGGDEFVVLTMGTSDERIKNRLQTAIDTDNRRQQRPYKISLSIGIAYSDPENPSSIEQLLSKADGRMYQEKKRKKKKERD